MWTDADRETYRDRGGRYPSDLTDAEWALLAPLLSGYDPLTADLREMVNACLYLEKTGCPWRSLPTDFGPRPTVRTWHDRFRADGLWSELAALLTRAVRQRCGRRPEPSTGILDSRDAWRAGRRLGRAARTVARRFLRQAQDEGGIKRHVLTCSVGFVLASLVTTANVHDTQAAGWLLDRAAQAGWRLERIKVDGIYVGARMGAAAERHGLDVQVTTRERDAVGFKPLPLRWRIEATFGTLTTRYRRLTRNLEQSLAAAEDAIDIANCHRLIKDYQRNA